MDIYRSRDGARSIASWCRARLDDWPVEHERLTVATSLGPTFAVAADRGQVPALPIGCAHETPVHPRTSAVRLQPLDLAIELRLRDGAADVAAQRPYRRTEVGPEGMNHENDEPDPGGEEEPGIPRPRHIRRGREPARLGVLLEVLR
jgi:hypothetical protein